MVLTKDIEPTTDDNLLAEINKYELFEILNKDIPPMEFLVDGLISTPGLTILAGRPKIGKSYLLLNIAVAIAYGHPILNYYPLISDFNVCYLDLESGERRTKTRLNQVLQGADGPRKNKIHMIHRMAPFNEGGKEILEQLLLDDPKIKLIFVDVMQKFFPRGKGSQSDAYSETYKGLGDFQEWLIDNNIAAVALHHLRKANRSFSGYADVYEEFTGTTAITGVSDNLMALYKKDGEIVLGVKGRDIEDKETVVSFNDGIFNTQGIDLIAMTESKNKYLIVKCLKDAHPMALTQKEIAEDTGIPQSKVSINLKKLLANNEIIETKSTRPKKYEFKPVF